MKNPISANFKKWTKADVIWMSVALFIITCVCILTWEASDNWISVIVLIGTVFVNIKV